MLARRRRRITLIVFLFLSSVAPSETPAQSRPAPPPEQDRAAPGRPGWSVDVRMGCWVWNAEPQPNETVSWSGGCGPDGRANGYGVVDWKARGGWARFEGEYREGKEHGRGLYTWENGERYQGEFRAGEREGRGTWVSPNGDRYEGEFRNGEPDGRGVWMSASGERYEGDFHNGKPHGRGDLTIANGSRYEGDWINGCFRDGKRRASIVIPLWKCR